MESVALRLPGVDYGRLLLDSRFQCMLFVSQHFQVPPTDCTPSSFSARLIQLSNRLQATFAFSF